MNSTTSFALCVITVIIFFTIFMLYLHINKEIKANAQLIEINNELIVLNTKLIETNTQLIEGETK